MSGKQMKKLRRQAEIQTVGNRWDSCVPRQNFNPKGRAVGIRIEQSQQSGRGVYQRLKKEQTNGSR